LNTPGKKLKFDNYHAVLAINYGCCFLLQYGNKNETLLINVLSTIEETIFLLIQKIFPIMVKATYDPIKYKTPTGNKLSCKGWIQEAALRMLLNNLDPAVAERPDDLIVYGGRGKAARNFEALDNIIKALKVLENDESLLIQSGKPVGILKTHKDAPRVLIN
jgi:hypothetical protein